MNITIIGTGYVGLVTGTCFAEIGNQVLCVDNDKYKIDMLQNNRIPIYEPGLEKLVHKNTSQKRLRFTSSVKEGVNSSEIIFICVGTPPRKDGEADLSSVEKVCQQIARFAKSYKLVVEKSTVPVQTGIWIKQTFKMCNTHVGLDVASNPEFLREGSAIIDFLNPDRIVIGVETERAENILRELYQPIIYRKIDPSLQNPSSNSEPVPFIVTDIQSAELIKHACNSFLATKISFINAIADLCEKVGADVEKVAQAMGLDKRIGKHFLKAGLGFGGFCFPKDLQAFIKIAEKFGYDFALLKEVERINNQRPLLLIEKIKQALWILKDKTIGILGLSFKPNTDDIRFAPSLEVIKRLQEEGAKIKAYDPAAMEKIKKLFPSVSYENNPYEVAKGSDALIILTDWDEFKNLNLKKIKSLLIRPIIVDGRNIFDPNEMNKLGFLYKCFGRNVTSSDFL
ncbi:MAG: UDP-glucose 6-dehydrogenase [Candidatus Neomarinimicrobiota bacterium]|nr:MAG: UDP-glucose 6-dehydrogenase [Candidatus Neomarinimicrobiota bacterium]